MLANIIKDPRFRIVFSFVLGFAIACLFRPLCDGTSKNGNNQCRKFKGPNVKEMEEHVYRLGEKCYKFTPNTMECPAGGVGVIESFKVCA